MGTEKTSGRHTLGIVQGSTQESTELKNARLRWHTRNLVLKVHVISLQP